MKKYRVVFPDMNGALRGKLVAEEYFQPTKAIGMPRSVLVADITGSEVEALPEFYIDTGDTDMKLLPDESTLVEVPGTIDYAQVIADVTDNSGMQLAVSPRALLQQIVAGYENQGYVAQMSSELEFYVYHPDGSQLNTQEADGPYGDINILDKHGGFIDEVVNLTRQLGLQPEMVVTESGQGQFEVTFGPEAPLFMADRTAYFKQLVKEIARKYDLRATFMAKPFLEDDGSGGHIHLSVYRNNLNILTDPNILEHFISGQLRYMRYLSLLFAPNTNSYRRWHLGHGYAPEAVSYGEEARNVGIRILGDGKNRRIEHRVCGADKNTYLVFAAVLAAGLKGLENGWTYETPEVAAEIGQQLPKDLPTALDLFRQGPAAELLGEEFVRVFTAVKDQELQLFANAAIDQEVESYGQQV